METRPCTTIGEALAAIDAHPGPAETFTLPLADSAHDPMGMAIAILTDRILARGWEPGGCEQGEGFRIYRYKTMGA